MKVLKVIDRNIEDVKDLVVNPDFEKIDLKVLVQEKKVLKNFPNEAVVI